MECEECDNTNSMTRISIDHMQPEPHSYVCSFGRITKRDRVVGLSLSGDGWDGSNFCSGDL